jgi:3',5'-cyclic AMP phosphodiesterase CpdA
MPQARHRLALIADAHLHDPAGDFGGAGFPIGGRPYSLRPWEAVRASGRAVNESAMAFRAALERIAASGIRLVVLAGDYSDDGQAENLRRLSALLHEAEARLGLRFLALPGNHDGYGVAGKHLAIRQATGPGQSELVTSDPDLAAAHAPGSVLSAALRCPGFPQALEPMAAFGLRRQPWHLHWESPFGPSDSFEDRRFLARSADGGTAHWLTDASYLVEPEPGLWLLMLDATVFEPRPGIADPRRKRAFHDPATAGWEAVLRVKPFLLDWIGDVVRRARQQGKLLLPVSHYPILPPLPGFSAVMPDDALARRSPSPAVAERLAAAGLRLHFGGHLHLHATSRAGTAAGQITDVSLPSTCAFPPAFTLLEGDADGLSMTTMSLADLPPDPLATALYAAEGAGLHEHDQPFGRFLAACHRNRLLTRRLPRGAPPGIWPALADRRLSDLPLLIGATGSASAAGAGPPLPEIPLADVLPQVFLLVEGGALALPHLPPDRVALLHRLAEWQGSAEDPAGLWLRALLRLLAAALARANQQGPVQGLGP